MTVWLVSGHTRSVVAPVARDVVSAAEHITDEVAAVSRFADPSS
ncbi:hypothetical protein [Nakamurella leprariae]|nr:hypothetical protein [Nakamurella leprariae]